MSPAWPSSRPSRPSSGELDFCISLGEYKLRGSRGAAGVRAQNLAAGLQGCGQRERGWEDSFRLQRGPLAGRAPRARRWSPATSGAKLCRKKEEADHRRATVSHWRRRWRNWSRPRASGCDSFVAGGRGAWRRPPIRRVTITITRWAGRSDVSTRIVGVSAR